MRWILNIIELPSWWRTFRPFLKGVSTWRCSSSHNWLPIVFWGPGSPQLMRVSISWFSRHYSHIFHPKCISKSTSNTIAYSASLFSSPLSFPFNKPHEIHQFSWWNPPFFMVKSPSSEAYDLFQLLRSSRSSRLPCLDQHLPGQILSPGHAVVLHGEARAARLHGSAGGQFPAKNEGFMRSYSPHPKISQEWLIISIYSYKMLWVISWNPNYSEDSCELMMNCELFDDT